MHYDPITDLERLGYTRRQAAFLYLVGRNSGFFLRRQFVQFANGTPGALPQHFINKAVKNAHVATLDYGQRRHVYHLNSRTIYRVLQIDDCPSRRVKGDHEIATRLLIVDYLLERLDESWLSTEQEKIAFFQGEKGLDPVCFPRSPAAKNTGTIARFFPDRLPIAIRYREAQGDPAVRFTYFDESACTVAAFTRYLEMYQQLFQSLRAFELDYVAFSARNFAAAEAYFHKRFSSDDAGSGSRLLPLGCDHLTRFFAAEQRWDENDPRFSQADLAVLREGEKVYTSPEHESLRMAWRRGPSEFDHQLKAMGERSHPEAVFKPCLIEQSYPIFGYKNAGHW